MLKLVQFRPAFNVRNMSPFCLKLETYLRMTGIAHEVVWASDTRSAPKGKLPYIVDGDVTLGDSSLIVNYLKSKHGDPLDGTLDTQQRAQLLVWQRLFEDSLLYPMIYCRWIEPAGWARISRIFDKMPVPLRWFVPQLVRGRIRKTLHLQGMGRHTPGEIVRFGAQYLAAIETQLGAREFMLSAAPTSLDATAYGFLAQLVESSLDNPLAAKAKATPSFVAYCARMKQRYFADLA